MDETKRFADRRKSVQGMSDDQFREFVLRQFEAGRLNMSELRGMIEENTTITKQNVAATATIVSIVSFSENSAKRVVKIGRFLSIVARILIPIVTLYGLCIGIAHGKFPTWKDLFQ